MTEMPFDTEKMVGQLEEAGVPTPQARAHAAVLSEIIVTMETAIIERCATKQDIRELRDEIRDMKADLESRFAGVDVQFAKVNVQFAQVNAQFAQVNAQFAKVDARMDRLRAELVRWVVTVGILQTALIVALVLKLVA